MKIISNKEKQSIWKELLMIHLFLSSINRDGKNKNFDKLLDETQEINNHLMKKFV